MSFRAVCSKLFA